jgi:hypothetical protein
MRHRVKEFQKVLNRAKMEGEATGEKERRTVTYVFSLSYFLDGD